MSADMAALLGGAPPPGLADTGGPPGPDALVGGPDTGGPPGPDNFVGGPGAAPTSTRAITSDHVGASSLDHIRTAIMALQVYAEGEDDDQDLALVHKVITQLQQLLASHAKDRDAALGTAAAHRHVRRASRGRSY